MKIVIDARMYNQSGIGRYIRNLLGQLQRLDKDNEYFILLVGDDYNEVVLGSNFTKVLADFGWYSISEQIKLPKIINELETDLAHFPHFNVPIFYNGKFVVTIHDLIHQHFQMRRATTHDPIIYKIKQFGYNQVFKKAINNACKILAPSNYVKDLLVKEWKLDKDKIVVTYEAVDDKIFSVEKIMKEEIINQVMNKYNIKQPYVFYVGNAHPHKNVEGLVRVFGVLREKYPNLSLVLSGDNHYFWQRIKQSLATSLLKGDIVFTGFVRDEELVALYKNAQCFVMPSFEEGFGIPLLEAMVCGCPIVSSNAGALPEVGGDAAIYFDPKDMDDFENKIDKVLGDYNLRNELIEKGQKRVKLFSWKKLAEQTLEVYKDLLRASPELNSGSRSQNLAFLKGVSKT